MYGVLIGKLNSPNSFAFQHFLSKKCDSSQFDEMSFESALAVFERHARCPGGWVLMTDW